MIYIYQVNADYFRTKVRFLFGYINPGEYDDGYNATIEEHQSREPHVTLLLEAE